MYNDLVMEHMRNPRNVGRIADADALGEATSKEDSDIIDIYIKVQDDTIINITFQTFGCAAAIAVSSMLTELAKGIILEEHGTNFGSSLSRCPWGNPRMENGMCEYCNRCLARCNPEISGKLRRIRLQFITLASYFDQ